MHAILNHSDATPDGPTPAHEGIRLSGVVVTLALLTCMFIVALPLLGSLAAAAVILALFASAGLATIFALSRL
ncbi:hypothetical protein [Williamsia maris]|uniref:Uncharacterized protein n=1 Tax=Williamsia maris TaxID=72806 RepID=A0ABT1HCU6_9NOCA|nr:hypothetical protein [Williamsia maris]MCP2176083.1 hypothetical protein [Williamsia maris]